MILSQRAIGLYTLRLNVSNIQLNIFARRALSQLTTTFNAKLYEDFLNAWGTHIITRSLIGGMIEERARVKECATVSGDDAVTRCLRLSGRTVIPSDCSYYNNRSRIISKRYLGGNIDLENEAEWKRTIAVGPALLQILDVVPWNDFVQDETIKENLRIAIRYRVQLTDAVRAEAIRQISSRSVSCSHISNALLNNRPNNCVAYSDTELG